MNRTSAEVAALSAIRRLRLQRGRSLEQLAEACGLSSSQLSRIETGKRGLKARELATILHALDLTPPEQGAVLARFSRLAA